MEKAAARTGASSYRYFRPCWLYTGYVSAGTDLCAVAQWSPWVSRHLRDSGCYPFLVIPSLPCLTPFNHLLYQVLRTLHRLHCSTFQRKRSCRSQPSNVGLRRKQCCSVHVSKKYYFIMLISSFTHKPHNCGGFFDCLFVFYRSFILFLLTVQSNHYKNWKFLVTPLAYISFVSAQAFLLLHRELYH